MTWYYLIVDWAFKLILKIIESEKLTNLLLVIADSQAELKESVINLPLFVWDKTTLEVSL
ncbi:MAG: hypothetical protein HC862_28965 [Scytonema sp. RU_4_4]|nr:hypothetical protein [Scytonema sp. RU_4_4]NJR75563.1 hypothetical protein [Scytonema sp. CRU_2_7]